MDTERLESKNSWSSIKAGRWGLHRADIIVDDKVLIEVKAVTGLIQRIHVAQTVSERKVSKVPVAMVVNFGDTRVQIRRLEERDL